MWADIKFATHVYMHVSPSRFCLHRCFPGRCKIAIGSIFRCVEVPAGHGAPCDRHAIYDAKQVLTLKCEAMRAECTGGPLAINQLLAFIHKSKMFQNVSKQKHMCQSQTFRCTFQNSEMFPTTRKPEKYETAQTQNNFLL